MAGDARAQGEAILDMTQSERETLARALLPCLPDPDPALRDGAAFTALSQMLRSELIGVETVAALKAELLDMLTGDDPGGFARPFAARTLAEVTRTDRMTPWMTGDERSALIAAAHTYLADLSDYRGFNDAEGWRHGVAHTADHAYIFGESERLAAPVLYLAQKDLFTEADWTAWFESLWPVDDPLWENADSSEVGLAKLHNLRAFSQAVYVSAKASNEAAYDPLRRAAFAFLNALP